jgi:hypothetical protein
VRVSRIDRPSKELASLHVPAGRLNEQIARLKYVHQNLSGCRLNNFKQGPTGVNEGDEKSTNLDELPYTVATFLQVATRGRA